MSARSSNFFLVGNVNEAQLRGVARRLEQFRRALSLLSAGVDFSAPVPTTVVVFRDDESFLPFRPVTRGQIANVEGYFVTGQDVNYIALTSSVRVARPDAVIFHEYAHSLMADAASRLPLWLQEGLAEFYSSLDVSGHGESVTVGKPIMSHILLLHTRELIPLAELLAMDQAALRRQDLTQTAVFYAESWALVHHLLMEKRGKRQTQLAEYTRLLLTGVPANECFSKAFQTGLDDMENELRKCVGRGSYRAMSLRLSETGDSDAQMEVAAMSDAAAQFYQGDLLLHVQRFDEAQAHLKQALALDPASSSAHASLGLLAVSRQRWDDARQHFERAVRGGTSNFFVYFRFAQLLAGAVRGEEPAALSAESAASVRTLLSRAIDLNPRFPQSYRLLAKVNMMRGEQLKVAAALMMRALDANPGQEDLALDLGQVYLKLRDFQTARGVVEPLVRRSASAEMRERAAQLLEAIDQLAPQRARPSRVRDATGPPVDDRPGVGQATLAPARWPSPSTPRRGEAAGQTPLAPASRPSPSPKKTRAVPELAEVSGLLVRLDCHALGLVFVVKSGARDLHFFAAKRRQIKVLPETRGSLDDLALSCGPRRPPAPVKVTYAKRSGRMFDGDLQTVTFTAAQ